MIVYTGNFSLPRKINKVITTNDVGLLLSYPHTPPKTYDGKYVIDNKMFACVTRNIEFKISKCSK